MRFTITAWERLFTFRTLWTANGILILLGGSALLGLSAWALIEKYRHQWAYDEAHAMVNIEPEVKAGWDLGAFERVHGSDYLIAPVFSKQSYRVRSLDKEASATRNYLLLKESDKSTRWVVKGNETLVLSFRQYSADGEWLSGTEAKKATRWLLLELVAKDSKWGSAAERCRPKKHRAERFGGDEVLRDTALGG